MSILTPAASGDVVSTELLAVAADLLPLHLGEGSFYLDALHEMLHDAALLLGTCTDPHRAHALADAAESLLVTYLVRAGLAEPQPCERCTLRGWLLDQPLAVVVRQLRALASVLRLHQLARGLGPQGLSDRLLDDTPDHEPLAGTALVLCERRSAALPSAGGAW